MTPETAPDAPTSGPSSPGYLRAKKLPETAPAAR